MPKGAGLTKPMKLSTELADIVGKKEASRAECIKQLWAYIKKNNLQDPENKQFFNPDKKMAKVINFFDFSIFVLIIRSFAVISSYVQKCVKCSLKSAVNVRTTQFSLKAS